MKLKLQNILKVESADIELGGLTVITGENDSGKSTIGKVLFSILKAANNVKQVDKIKTVRLVRTRLSSIRWLFRRYDKKIQMFEDLGTLSYELVEKNLLVEELSEIVEKEAIACEFSSRQMAILRSDLNHIYQSIIGLNNPILAVKREFESISKSEFMESLNSHGTHNSIIYFHDDTTDADGSDIKFVLEDGTVSDVSLWGNSSIEDITYIESPVYLHILNTLRMASPNRGISNSYQRGNVPYHLVDMAEKILSSEDIHDMYDDLLMGNDKPQIDKIRNLIDGDFTINSKDRQLYFERNGKTIPTVSVASGIKSFGVLMQLLKTANISTSKILVLDEPEIHLHPEWQVAFCEFIVDLVANGIPIVVSSHSPYFIQGLRYYAAAKDIEKDVIYYMAEQNQENGLSVFKEVTNDLNKVFTLLAAPLREIMNVDAVRNSKK